MTFVLDWKVLCDRGTRVGGALICYATGLTGAILVTGRKDPTVHIGNLRDAGEDLWDALIVNSLVKFVRLDSLVHDYDHNGQYKD